jgi:hypothetical protein
MISMREQIVEEQAMSLSAKNRRRIQGKCPHEEIYTSAVIGPSGSVINSFCLDCGKSLYRGE